jgi:hypothetical protein
MKHINPTIVLADFLLAICDGEQRGISKEKLLSDLGEAFQHDDAISIMECCPSEGTMRDVTEDLANAWWERWGGPYEAVPAVFAQFLEDSAQDEHDAAEDPNGVWQRADDQYAERVGK